MANRYASRSGNWSDVTVWDGGTTLPQSNDIVRPNGFTVAIDQDIVVAELTNNAQSPAGSGGSFLLNAGRTVTAAVNARFGATVLTVAAGDSTVIGNCQSFISAGIAIAKSTTGTLSLVGNITAGQGTFLSGANGIEISAGNLVVTGNLTAGTILNIYGLSHAINSSTNGSLTINGNLIGPSDGSSSNSTTINQTGSGPATIVGNVSTNGAVSPPLNWSGTGALSITGSITGGTNSEAVLLSVCTLTVTGDLIASTFPAIRFQNPSVSAIVIHNGNCVANVAGVHPAFRCRYLLSPSAPLNHTYRVNNSGVAGAARTLFTGGVNLGQPTVANVRAGSTFGVSSEYVGTLAVPLPSLVAIGVATDNTVGTFNPSPGTLVDTTIATLASQTVFTLTAGSSDNNAYNGQTVVVSKSGTPTRKEVGTVLSYVGSTRQVTLVADPGVMTIAVGDSISILSGSAFPTAAPTDWLTGAGVKADAVTKIQTGLATASQINSLQVNTRANLQVPIEIETPDSGTQVWKIRLFLFDEEGNMEAPDSTPTVALVNASGTSRSSRLSAATVIGTGVYSWDYTSTAGDAEEQLVWTFTVVEGGLTRTYPADSYVVEETAYRFSSSDRATLQATATASALSAVATNASTAATQATQANTKAGTIQTKTDQLTFTTAGKVDSTAVLDPSITTQLDAIEAAVAEVPITVNNYGQFDNSGALLLKRGHTATVIFTSTTSNLVPDMSDDNTKVFFGIYDTARRQWLQVEGTKVVNTGLQSISFTIPADKAASMITGVHLFDAVVVYGYTSGSPSTYTSLRPFASGNVRVVELSLDLTAL